MHALDFIKRDLPFEIARERFISWVCPFQSLGDKRITIVFDDNVHTPGPHELHSRIRVLYSSEGFNADGTILSLVRQMPSSQRQYVVAVTRDGMLRDALLSYGCTVISPESFANEFQAYCAHTQRKTDHFNFGQADEAFSYRPFKEFFE
jgi:Predicted RNA-binding protein containing a PIN domain